LKITSTTLAEIYLFLVCLGSIYLFHYHQPSINHQSTNKQYTASERNKNIFFKIAKMSDSLTIVNPDSPPKEKLDIDIVSKDQEDLAKRQLTFELFSRFLECTDYDMIEKREIDQMIIVKVRNVHRSLEFNTF